MTLNVRTFFALYNEGVRMETRQYRELLRISAVPMMKLEYYNYHMDRYQAMIDPKVKELPPPARGPVIDAGSKEAKVLIMNVFASLKRNLGYGGR